ncbi:hypothetical protein WJU23_05375 [Prosthecobacter sp. SYSU 5D2]|uniref:hypothetical protein n=1 Tax=Prosthecobacter sp. SYSU 5D2 TaxID=3134134 RepID=UPI0031FF0F68
MSAGLFICLSEVAVVRVHPDRGTDGNEVTLKSGKVILCSFQQAQTLAEKLHQADQERAEAEPQNSPAHPAGREAFLYLAS